MTTKMTINTKSTIENLIASKYPSIVSHEHTYKMMFNMLGVILKDKELIVFVRDFNNDNTGFMWSDHPFINKIGSTEEVYNDLHSGASFACTLRNCQYVLRDIDENAVVIKENGDITINSLEKNEESSTKANDGAGSDYIFYECMDENNKKVMDTMVKDGVDAAIEQMFKHPKTGETMDYASMRYYYG